MKLPWQQCETFFSKTDQSDISLLLLFLVWKLISSYSERLGSDQTLKSKGLPSRMSLSHYIVHRAVIKWTGRGLVSSGTETEMVALLQYDSLQKVERSNCI